MEFNIYFEMLTIIFICCLFLKLNFNQDSDEIAFIVAICKSYIYFWIAVLTMTIVTNANGDTEWIGFFSPKLSFPVFMVSAVSLFETLACFINTIDYVKKWYSENPGIVKEKNVLLKGFRSWKVKPKTWTRCATSFYIILIMIVMSASWVKHTLSEKIVIICSILGIILAFAIILCSIIFIIRRIKLINNK